MVLSFSSLCFSLKGLGVRMIRLYSLTASFPRAHSLILFPNSEFQDHPSIQKLQACIWQHFQVKNHAENTHKKLRILDSSQLAKKVLMWGQERDIHTPSTGLPKPQYLLGRCALHASILLPTVFSPHIEKPNCHPVLQSPTWSILNVSLPQNSPTKTGYLWAHLAFYCSSQLDKFSPASDFLHLLFLLPE